MLLYKLTLVVGILERPHMDYLLKEGGLREVCGGLDFDLVILPGTVAFLHHVAYLY